MPPVELEEAMETQRAIRRLKADPVGDDVILRCLELATKAPSGSNEQGWEFIVVRDPEVKRRLGRINAGAWNILRRTLYGRARDAERRMVDAVTHQAQHWDEIPVVVVACIHGITMPFPWIQRASRYASIYPAVQNLLLAARALGLGAAMTTLPLWNRVAARRALGLPLNVEPVAAIPLGWPIGRYGPTTRKPVAEVTSLDRYGNRAFR
jgi:nitroreductase